MLQMSAFTASIPNTASDQQLIAIADGLIPTRDNALVVPPDLPRVLAVMFYGANLTVAKLKPASYRRFGDYWVLPYANAIGGSGAISPYLDLSQIAGAGPPLILDPQEELPAYGQQGSAGAQQAYAAVLFTEAEAKPHHGKFFTVHGTSTQTLTPNVWSTCVVTMDTGLPAGRYNLVGMRVQSAGCIFFRAVIVQQFHRPGGFGFQGRTSFEATGQRNGGWGVWGNFDHLSIPNVEIIATSADTAIDVFFDLEQSSSVAVQGPPTQPYVPVR
jgi:hypothetical protein